MSSFACSVRDLCCTTEIWSTTAPRVIDIRSMTTNSSISEKPCVPISDFRGSCFIRTSLESYDHFQGDGDGEEIRVRVSPGWLRRHDDESGVGTERFDIPANIVERLTVSGRGPATVVRHRIADYFGLREVNSSPTERGAGSAAGAGGEDGMAGRTATRITIHDGHVRNHVSGHCRDHFQGHLRQNRCRAIHLASVVVGHRGHDQHHACRQADEQYEGRNHHFHQGKAGLRTPNRTVSEFKSFHNVSVRLRQLSLSTSNRSTTKPLHVPRP